MNKALSFILFFFSSSFSFISFAQQPDENDRQKWISEVRNYKHEFLAKELDLSKSQQSEFFDIYDEMEDRVEKLNSESRDLVQRVLSDPDATDVELDAAARVVYQLKNEESKIELEYFDRFKKILQPRQLILLKSAERKFTQQLMIHHRRLKKADNGRKKS